MTLLPLASGVNRIDRSRSSNTSPSVLSFQGASPFPDEEDGKKNDPYKRDCLEEGDHGIAQCKVAQKEEPGCDEVEDSRSCDSDAALATIGEDNAYQEQDDDETDREPIDLVDGICQGRVEIDQEDRGSKDGIDHLFGDNSSLPRFLLSVFSRPESMTEDVYEAGVYQMLFPSVPHHNEIVRHSGNQCQRKHRGLW